MRSNQYGIDVKSDVNGKVSIKCSGKRIYGRFRHQGEIRWRVEVYDIEGRGTYNMIRVEGGTDLTSQA